jgi:hypothetical protein
MDHAKEHWGAIVGPAAGFLVLKFIITQFLAFIPFIGGLLSALIDIPLEAGLPIVCLLVLMGKTWSFGDFFGGFQIFGQTLGLAILQGLIAMGAVMPGVIIGVIAIVVMAQAAPAPGGGPGPEAILIAVPFFLLAVMMAIYVAIRTGFFALYLLLDRQFGIVEAIAGSWKLTRGHTLGLFGVGIVMGLITLGGALLCGIGVLLAIPFVALIQTAGYLLVAGSQPPVSRDYSGGSRRRDRDDAEDEDDRPSRRRGRDEDEDY